jgi:hypothetical protein
MLRLLTALLLAANLVFGAWTLGWLDGIVGVRARGDREPERLARQVHPELVRILGSPSTAQAGSTEALTSQCLQAGPFDDAGIAAAEAVLGTTMPSGAWVRLTTEQPARWMLYMGRYASREVLQRKEQELAQIQVAFDEVSSPGHLEPGLSLGRFTDRNAATAALAKVAQLGVQARVVELPSNRTQHMLRVEHAEPDQVRKLVALKLGAQTKGFSACGRPS